MGLYEGGYIGVAYRVVYTGHIGVYGGLYRHRGCI